MGAVAVQSTGKIVVGGGPNMTLVRLNADGSPDPSFPKPFWPFPPSSGPSQCLPPGNVRRRRRDLGPGHRPARRHGPRRGSGHPARVPVGMPGEHALREWPGGVPLRRGRRERGAGTVGDASRTRCRRCSGWRCWPMAHRSPRRGPRCTGWATSSSPWPTCTCRPVVLKTTSSDSWSTARTGSRWPRSTTTTRRSPCTGSAPESADPSFGDGGEVLETALGRVEGIAVDSLDRLVLTGSRVVRGPAPRCSPRRGRRARSDVRRWWGPQRLGRRAGGGGGVARLRRRSGRPVGRCGRPAGRLRPRHRLRRRATSSSAATWSTGRRIRRSTTTAFGSRRTP